MSDFFEFPTVSATGNLLVLGVLVAVGLWLVSIFHGHDDDDRETPEWVLSNFEEML